MGKPYDGRKVDSWSAGCVLFIMLTHRMAFREKMGNRALVQQQLAGVKWPQSCEHLLSPDVKSLVVSILKFNYADRPFCDEILLNKWFEKDRDGYESNVAKWNEEVASSSQIMRKRFAARRMSLSLNALQDSLPGSAPSFGSVQGVQGAPSS